MTEHEKEQLLEEILGGQEIEALREATLRAGLRAVRWRRRKRFAAYAALIILPSLFVIVHPRHSRTPLIAQINPAPASPTVERINEQQLLALFPNRPLALVGKPGDQQLVFLDQPPLPK